MFGRRRPPDRTYWRSQREVTLPTIPTPEARQAARAILAAGDDHRERQHLAQRLVDELSASAGLCRVDVVVADRPQVHEHDGRRLQSRTYGYYRCWFADGAVSRGRIRIYHRTAVRHQVISTKVFLNTLLHEWVHHYDFAGLGLPRSPHTTGFFTRLRLLAEALGVGFLLPPEPEDAAGAPAPAAVARRSGRLRA